MARIEITFESGMHVSGEVDPGFVSAVRAMPMQPGFDPVGEHEAYIMAMVLWAEKHDVMKHGVMHHALVCGRMVTYADFAAWCDERQAQIDAVIRKGLH